MFKRNRSQLPATLPPPQPPQTWAALPVTGTETTVLVEAMTEADRLSRGTLPHEVGLPWARHRAQDLLREAGAAVAAGHSCTPIRVVDLDTFDNVLKKLQSLVPNDRITHQCTRLLAVMNVRAGVAEVRGWRVAKSEIGFRWTGEVPRMGTNPADPATTPLAIDPPVPDVFDDAQF